jgi:hypothetical protein
MNAMKRVLFRGATTMMTWLGIAVFAATAWAADELVRIDFRNKIPGVLDAPVFHFDGVTRLDGRFTAELLAGTTADGLTPLANTQGFLTGTDAGYLPYESPQERFIDPQPVLGQPIWFQVHIWEHLSEGPFGKWICVGRSKVHSMVVTNYVMPLVGLESFSLVPEQLRITWHSDQVVVQWPYLAAQRYELQTTSSLQPPILWSPIFEWSGIADNHQELSVTNAVTPTPRFYRLERWEWP